MSASRTTRLSVLTALVLVLPLFVVGPVRAASPDVVISQVYGGGGNSGATYTNDFVELFNRGSSTVDISGWSVQYASATGTGNFGLNPVAAVNGSLEPGQYYLVQLAAGSGGTASLPTPNALGSANMSGVAGKVALVTSTTGLACNGGSTPCDAGQLAQIKDLVGYGGANFYEGSGPAPALSNFTAALRGGDGCIDTDDNAADFTAGSVDPRNTASPKLTCAGGPTTTLVINEVNADPDATAGDANGDGVVDTSADEFVEIVNASGADADIGGWTLSDAVGVRHTFPAGTVVADGCAVVVFGGSTPTGSFGGATVQTASTGLVGLNNDGDTVTVSDGGGHVVSTGYGSEGGDNQSLTRDPDITGGDPLAKHTLATGSGGSLFSPGTLVDGSAFGGCAPTGPTFIHDVQGSGAASPLVGQTVTVEGVVVGDFQDGAAGTFGDLNGFHLQEEDAEADTDPLTSEGIFVFDGSTPAVDVQVGDLVAVQGLVSEFNGMTEISATSVTVMARGTALPAPTTVSLPLTVVTDLEAVEGMYVTFPQDLVISEYFNFDRFNEIVLTSERHLTPTAEFEPGPDAIAAAQAYLLDRITLDDGRSISNPEVTRHPNGQPFGLGNRFRGGDTLTDVAGVIDYSFGLYRVQPTAGATYTPVNHRTSAPDDVGGSVSVASFNVLNYFTTLDYPTGDPRDNACGPAQNQQCRGADADQPFELTRQRDKILAALTAIDADVVGLIEIENHPGDVPTEDLVDGLNDIVGADTYDYIATGAIGTDAIRVALIYKSANVSPVGSHAILDSVVDDRFDDEKNRPVLAQSFMDTTTGGIFTVAVNHLKSKSSPCDDVGDPDLGDGAGNCNVTRANAAAALVDWLSGDPTHSGDDDALIIGDLNSYDLEDPIDTIVAGSYADLVRSYLGEDAYSYVFDGQIGYLDHALANDALVDEVTGTTVWHLNADEPDLLDYDTSFKSAGQDAIYAPDAYRSSDHDPVIVGLAACDEIAPTFDVLRVTPNVLFPPDHRYVDVTAEVEVSDDFDDSPAVRLVEVTSNEPDNGEEDGNTVNDIVIVDDLHVRLRAERSGVGTGRIYTLTYEASDACGNTTTADVTVTVPLSGR